MSQRYDQKKTLQGIRKHLDASGFRLYQLIEHDLPTFPLELINEFIDSLDLLIPRAEQLRAALDARRRGAEKVRAELSKP